jgi:soluble lytic murein transglycosylase
VAAYNAGPGNARRIIAQTGDPRATDIDPIDWVETLPIAETRTYVQRVLENAVVYDLLHPQTALSQGQGRLSWYLNSGRRLAPTAPSPPGSGGR